MLTLFCRLCLFIPWSKGMNEFEYKECNFLSDYYNYSSIIIMFQSIDINWFLLSLDWVVHLIKGIGFLCYYKNLLFSIDGL